MPWMSEPQGKLLADQLHLCTTQAASLLCMEDTLIPNGPNGSNPSWPKAAEFLQMDLWEVSRRLGLGCWSHKSAQLGDSVFGMFKSLSLYICTLKYSNRYLNFHKVWLHLKYGWKWDFLDPEIRNLSQPGKIGKTWCLFTGPQWRGGDVSELEVGQVG